MRMFFILCFCSVNVLMAQQETKPKLVVGIVVDQMRAEYLYRFQDNYSQNGFKRLMREGFNVKNMHYNYAPTATGPGHASIYTGTTPTNHGIVNNDWYSRKLRDTVYCAQDNTVNQVGAIKDGQAPFTLGQRSPKNLKTTTITDELKLFSNGRSKVIGISLKDRGAILPAGHLADGAYWYNTKNGDFITSTYYANKLPEWLIQFNARKQADSLLNLKWKPIVPIKKYINSGLDDSSYEKVYIGKSKSTFPYNLKKLRKQNGNFSLLSKVPFGNTLLTSLAIEAIKNENLGQSTETDFLTISYSATDYVGHDFGIRSKELEDTYVRMDLEIALLLEALDTNVGMGNYMLFLTADHGAGDHPDFLKSHRLPGESYSPTKIQEDLNTYLSKTLGEEDYIAFLDKSQLYFNETKAPKEHVINKAVSFLQSVPGIKEVFAPSLVDHAINKSVPNEIIKNSYSRTNSGDILFHFYSGWMEKRPYGTNHSNLYTSDTHVPMLWYGSNIKQGETTKVHTITQIVPSLSMLFNIPLPSASDIHPIEELWQN